MNSHRLRFVLAAVCLVALIGCACGQTRPFGVMTYNVENLFDTCHDAGFDDYEFLPMAERQWDTRRYRTKLSRLARVIASAGGAQPLALVGLCEVENDSVVYDLCHRTRLARLGYDFIVTHSRDVRGIDVALLYQPLRFRPIAVKAVRVEPPGEYGRHTRDILHVTGLLPTADTLEVFVCHSPSRLGGLRVADDYRRQVAERVRSLADSALSRRAAPYAVIMGDFNDAATDPSIRLGLRPLPLPDAAAWPSADVRAYYAMANHLTASDGIAGTYKYRGEWNRLDQMFVSGALLRPESSLHVTPEACQIFAPPFLRTKDARHGGVKPRRTYLGTQYAGGFSDHFPLLLHLAF